MTKRIQKFEAFKSSWYVWLFPAIAVLVSGWLFADYYKQKGETIRILFDDASGIQPEKTRVRYRGVPVGVVKEVSLSEDNKDVIVTVTLQKDAEQFAVDGSKFGLVLPKVNFQGVSGLETIFEGTYISVSPGPADGKTKKEFKAQAGANSNDGLDDTSAYFLETGNAESISVGDSVTFRGLKVGSVTKTSLSKNSQIVLVQINIENKYIRLIRSNTVFWRKVAVQAKLGLFNSELKINSLDSVLHGGIDFSTPDPVGEVAKAHAKFGLQQSPPKDSDKWNPVLEL